MDPLVEPHPRIDADGAARLLGDLYGLEGELLRLHGERDVNFRVDATTGRRYLLKIHNPSDGADVVEMRTGAIEHIRRVDSTLPVSAVIPARSGAVAPAVMAPDGRTSLVQLFEFLDGHHAGREELGEAELFAWGGCVARLGRALRGYFHPAARYRIQWDLALVPQLRRQLDSLGEDLRWRVSELLDRFDVRVAPVLPSLRAQLIHNDLTRENLLVDGTGCIVGITDFGDMTHTALVCDLAIAISDVLDGRPDSLEMAEAMVAGHVAVTPLEDAEAAMLSDLVAARCVTAIVVSAAREADHPAPTEFPGALEFLDLIDRASPDGVGKRFRNAALRGSSSITIERLPYAERSTPELLEARHRVLGPLELSYDEPLHLVRGEGVHLLDADGRRYVDAYNNVPVVGHCHPEVVAAVAAQAARLVTNTRYLHEASVELAERLLATMPPGLDRVLFVNSGSEANDVAWRISQFATGNDGAVVTSFAYHGITEATTELSPEGWPAGYRPERVALVAGPRGEVDEALGGASDVAAGIDELARRGRRPAALFVDSAFTSDGVHGPAPDWLLASAHQIRAAGGLVVADEVQAGYGRCGEALWSFAPSGLVPDFVTLGKPMGNGFPVAALVGRSELVDPFMAETGYFSTFGGNTLACAAALAVLDVVEARGLVAHAGKIGEHLRIRLDEVTAGSPFVGGVRSWGLLAAVDIVDPMGPSKRPDPESASRIVNAMRHRRVLIGTTGPSGATLKIRPPLVLGIDDADEIAESLGDALRDLSQPARR